MHPDGQWLVRQLIRKLSKASISINNDLEAHGSAGISCLTQRGSCYCGGCSIEDIVVTTAKTIVKWVRGSARENEIVV